MGTYRQKKKRENRSTRKNGRRQSRRQTLKGGDLKGGDLKGGDLKGGNLKGGNLKGGNLKGGDLYSITPIITHNNVGFESGIDDSAYINRNHVVPEDDNYANVDDLYDRFSNFFSFDNYNTPTPRKTRKVQIVMHTDNELREIHVLNKMIRKINSLITPILRKNKIDTTLDVLQSIGDDKIKIYALRGLGTNERSIAERLIQTGLLDKVLYRSEPKKEESIDDRPSYEIMNEELKRINNDLRKKNGMPTVYPDIADDESQEVQNIGYNPTNESSNYADNIKAIEDADIRIAQEFEVISKQIQDIIARVKSSNNDDDKAVTNTSVPNPISPGSTKPAFPLGSQKSAFPLGPPKSAVPLGSPVNALGSPKSAAPVNALGSPKSAAPVNALGSKSAFVPTNSAVGNASSTLPGTKPTVIPPAPPIQNASKLANEQAKQDLKQLQDLLKTNTSPQLQELFDRFNETFTITEKMQKQLDTSNKLLVSKGIDVKFALMEPKDIKARLNELIKTNKSSTIEYEKLEKALLDSNEYKEEQRIIMEEWKKEVEPVFEKWYHDIKELVPKNILELSEAQMIQNGLPPLLANRFSKQKGLRSIHTNSDVISKTMINDLQKFISDNPDIRELVAILKSLPLNFNESILKEKQAWKRELENTIRNMYLNGNFTQNPAYNGSGLGLPIDDVNNLAVKPSSNPPPQTSSTITSPPPSSNVSSNVQQGPQPPPSSSVIASNSSSSSPPPPPAIASNSSSSSPPPPPAIASNGPQPPPPPPPVEKKPTPRAWKAPADIPKDVASQATWVANAKKLWHEEEDARVAKEQAQQTEVYERLLEEWKQKQALLAQQKSTP